MNHSTETLSGQIEQLVREHIEASWRAAAGALERAFSPASTRPRSEKARATMRASGHRRPSAEVAALGESLYVAVLAHPGETMSVLGPALGKTPRELHRPMMMLKRAGRVRSVGQRHRTRYFPSVVRTG